MTQTPLTIPPQFNGVIDYASYVGIAFMGSFMRAAKWRDDQSGKILWWRVVTEMPIAVAVGSVAVGIGEFYHWDAKIIGGVCGLLGLLGPAFFTSLGEAVVSILQTKFGGQ